MSKTYTIRCKGVNERFNGTFIFNNSKFEAPGLLPGEKAKVSLLYGKDKGKAVVEEILEPSEHRVAPFCQAYALCGGCALQHTDYENSLKIKTQVVKDLIGGFVKVEDCVGAEKPLNYRNKINATLAKNKRGQVISGLYMESSHKVIRLNECAIENKNAAAVMGSIRQFMNDYHIEPFNEDKQTGILRHVLFRVAASGDTLVVLVSGNKIFPEKNKLAQAISEKHGFVKSVVLNYNLKKTSMILGDRDEILTGAGHVTDTMCGICFRISAHSFYQVNTPMAERLYTDAIKGAGLTKNDRILDAYCGIGTITSVAAKISGAKEVTGVELNASAVRDAKENAASAGLGNLRFVCSDAGDFLRKAADDGDHYSCVIMDPPRAGSSDKFLRALTKMAPEKVIYISCNPVALAHDLKILTRFGYRAVKATPYDMFPWTGNVETVVQLINQNANAKHHVEIGIDAEEYYKIKECVL